MKFLNHIRSISWIQILSATGYILILVSQSDARILAGVGLVLCGVLLYSVQTLVKVAQKYTASPRTTNQGLDSPAPLSDPPPVKSKPQWKDELVPTIIPSLKNPPRPSGGFGSPVGD